MITLIYNLFIIIRHWHYYPNASGFFFLYTDTSHLSVIQSNYPASHPEANQTFNSLMVPHSVIGLCSETNKQCRSRLVIP